MTVAALYVDARGVYPQLKGVDCWDEARDARRYRGPHPVVAHPPCGRWSCMRHLCRARSRDCALRAVAQVNAYGGVLEQPAYSRLFHHCGLPLPRVTTRLERGRYSVEVQQVAWGHVARKRTWLYFVGVDPQLVVQTIRTGGRITHWQAGAHNAKWPIPAGLKACSAQQRNRTPLRFAQWLVMLAESVS